MLRIEVTSNGPSGLTFSKLENYDIPAPEDGFQSEVNGHVVLQFEDEQDAIDYSHKIDQYAEALKDSSSAEYLIARDMIEAIGEDEFVQAYIQS